MGACQVSTNVFIVVHQDVPCIRNAQRYIGAMVRVGFSQDQIRVVVNQYTKKIGPNHASLEQIQQPLNQPVFYGIPGSPAMLAAINRARRNKCIPRQLTALGRRIDRPRPKLVSRLPTVHKPS